MAMEVGQRLPEVRLDLWTGNGGRRIAIGAFFAGKRIVLFAVPGAFTATCSETHLPGFLVRADDFKASGIVVYLGAEPGRDVGVSSAEAVLTALRGAAV